MKHISLLVLASLPLLIVGLAPTQAQKSAVKIRPVPFSVPLGMVYAGHSAQGDLQAALNDALTKAQQGVADSTLVSDGTFAWDLAGIHGVRGGIMGLQDIWVEVAVR